MELENQWTVQIGGNWVNWDGSICREKIILARAGCFDGNIADHAGCVVTISP